MMAKACKNKSLMGCSALGSTEGEVLYPEGVPSGVLSGHAYSVLDVFTMDVEVLDEEGEIKTVNEKLVRMRNPWGKKEWNGKWSDGSDELMDNMKALNAYVRRRRSEDPDHSDMALFDSDLNDGTFLINFHDWW